MLKIEYDIPVPSARRAAMLPENADLMDKMEEMEIGGSVFIPRSRKSISVFVCKRGPMLKRKFRAVAEGNGTRVFRVA